MKYHTNGSNKSLPFTLNEGTRNGFDRFWIGSWLGINEVARINHNNRGKSQSPGTAIKKVEIGVA